MFLSILHFELCILHLFHLDNGHAAVALAVFAKAEGRNAAVGFQMLPQRVLERTRALTVDQTYAPEIGKHGFVQILVHGKPSLVAKQTAQVDLVTEIAVDLCVKIGGRLALFAADDLRLFDDQL